MLERKIMIATAALTLFVTACSQTSAQVNNAGHEPFEQAEFEAALDAYEKAQEDAPDRGEPYYNAGNTLYRMEQYDDAIAEYDEALKYAEGDLRAQGLFNRGNAYFDREQYPQAIDAYKDVLRIQPDNLDAKHNLELALANLPPQEQQGEQGEEPDENEQEGPQPQDNQEQQPQDQDNQEQQQNDEQEDQEQEQPQPPPQTEPITEEQARQLLQTVGEDTETLQERLQQVLVSDDPPPENDW